MLQSNSNTQNVNSALQLTRDLLNYNTVNPPGIERACAQHVGKLLEDAGFRVAYHEFADMRTSVIATIGGHQEKPPICFTGHIDVVPLGTAATRSRGLGAGGALPGAWIGFDDLCAIARADHPGRWDHAAAASIPDDPRAGAAAIERLLEVSGGSRRY